MWMYTKHGAFSCVKSRQEPLDGMQVRARHIEYLEDLLDAVDLDLPIISTPNSDYGFRVIARPKQLPQRAQRLVRLLACQPHEGCNLLQRAHRLELCPLRLHRGWRRKC